MLIQCLICGKFKPQTDFRIWYNYVNPRCFPCLCLKSKKSKDYLEYVRESLKLFVKELSSPDKPLTPEIMILFGRLHPDIKKAIWEEMFPNIPFIQFTNDKTKPSKYTPKRKTCYLCKRLLKNYHFGYDPSKKDNLTPTCKYCDYHEYYRYAAYAKRAEKQYIANYGVPLKGYHFPMARKRVTYIRKNKNKNKNKNKK